MAAASFRSPAARAAIIEEEAADHVFQSAASSVVSVADFRTEKDGSETQEVRTYPPRGVIGCLQRLIAW